MNNHDPDQAKIDKELFTKDFFTILNDISLSTTMSTNQQEISPELGEEMPGLVFVPLKDVKFSNKRNSICDPPDFNTNIEMPPKKVLKKTTTPEKPGSGRLINIAPEIVANIVEHLNYDQCYFNFRLTCKALEAMSRHQFAKKFFTESYHMWAKWSLKEFKTITTVFAENIKTLNLAAITAKSFPGPETWRGTQHQRVAYDVFRKDEAGVIKGQSNADTLYMQMLRKAMIALPNLRTVRVTALLEHQKHAPCALQYLHPAVKRLCDRAGLSTGHDGLFGEGFDDTMHCVRLILRALAKSDTPIGTLEIGCMSLGINLMGQCRIGPCCFVPVEAFMTYNPKRARLLPTHTFDTVKHFSAQLMMSNDSGEHRLAARLVHSMKNLKVLRLSLATPTRTIGVLEAFFKTLIEKKLLLDDFQLWAQGSIEQEPLIKFFAHVSSTLRKLTLSTMAIYDSTWFELFTEDKILTKLDELKLIHVAELDMDDGIVSQLHHVSLTKEDMADEEKLKKELKPCPNTRRDITDLGSDMDLADFYGDHDDSDSDMDSELSLD